MTALDLQRIYSQDGLYIIEDERSPGTTGILLAMGAVRDSENNLTQKARIFTMVHAEELTTDWKSYPQTTHFMGGPFSVRTCKLLEGVRERLDAVEGVLTDTRLHIRGLRDIMMGGNVLDVKCARILQGILDIIENRAPAEA